MLALSPSLCPRAALSPQPALRSSSAGLSRSPPQTETPSSEFSLAECLPPLNPFRAAACRPLVPLRATGLLPHSLPAAFLFAGRVLLGVGFASSSPSKGESRRAWVGRVMQHSGLVRSAWRQKTRKEQQQHAAWLGGFSFSRRTYLVAEGRRQLRGESARVGVSAGYGTSLPFLCWGGEGCRSQGHARGNAGALRKLWHAG